MKTNVFILTLLLISAGAFVQSTFDQAKINYFMKRNSILYLLGGTLLIVAVGCSNPEKAELATVEANARIYKHTWDEILNHRKLEFFQQLGLIPR